MKTLSIVMAFQIAISATSALSAEAQSGIRIHIGQDGLDIREDEFTSYYQAPPERIVWLRREHIPEDQWPIIFEIAREGHTTPERVWEMHQRRSNWYDVLSDFNVPPSHFHHDKHPYKHPRWSDEELSRYASSRFVNKRSARSDNRENNGHKDRKNENHGHGRKHGHDDE